MRMCGVCIYIQRAMNLYTGLRFCNTIAMKCTVTVVGLLLCVSFYLIVAACAVPVLSPSRQTAYFTAYKVYRNILR